MYSCSFIPIFSVQIFFPYILLHVLAVGFVVTSRFIKWPTFFTKNTAKNRQKPCFWSNFWIHFDPAQAGGDILSPFLESCLFTYGAMFWNRSHQININPGNKREKNGTTSRKIAFSGKLDTIGGEHSLFHS